ncbi:hypothetical protein LCGC14_1124710 [marine sediment metagenome]|uniref:Uncharacterized protein n=1 Tax=marine sediment metagenome TaxID=412755 RepID=A0A0F9M2Z6_9ZZZZ
MSTDIRTWRCGKCPYTVDIPPEDTYTLFVDTLMRIREHRFAHLVDALTAATDEEIMALADDEPNKKEDHGAVVGEDAGYVLAGITELLKSDLPRAAANELDRRRG